MPKGKGYPPTPSKKPKKKKGMKDVAKKVKGALDNLDKAYKEDMGKAKVRNKRIMKKITGKK